MLYPKNIKYILIFIFLILSSCLNNIEIDKSKNQSGSDSFEMDRRVVKYCEISKKRFDYRWWSYYARGLCFAYHGKFKKAEYDFRQALNQKKGDQWNAEMFGYSYIDYLPYRELGIVLYEQGRLIESLENLKISNDKLKSARTEFYLNQVRKELILQGKIEDKHPPEIILNFPKKTEVFSNQFRILVDGKAKDDQFVKSIRIDGKEFPVDLAKKAIPFRTKVPVKPGKNEIDIEVEDLAGLKSKRTINVIGDFTGPSVSIDKAEISKDGILLLEGKVYDDLMLSDVVLNDNEVKIPVNNGNISTSVKLNNNKNILLKAKDAAGNINTVDVLKAYANSKDKEERQITLASLASDILVYNDNNKGKLAKEFTSLMICPGSNIYGKDISVNLSNASEENSNIRLATYCKSVIITNGEQGQLSNDYKIYVNRKCINKKGGKNIIHKHLLDHPKKNKIKIDILGDKKVYTKMIEIKRYNVEDITDTLNVCYEMHSAQIGGKGKFLETGGDKIKFREAIKSKFSNILMGYKNGKRFEVFKKTNKFDWKFELSINEHKDQFELIIRILNSENKYIPHRGYPENNTITYIVSWKEGEEEMYNMVKLDSKPDSAGEYIDESKFYEIFDRHLPKGEGVIDDIMDKKDDLFLADFSDSDEVVDYMPEGMKLNIFKGLKKGGNFIGYNLKNNGKARVQAKESGVKYKSKVTKYENEISKISENDIVVTR